LTSTIIDLMRHGEPQGGRAIRGNSINDPLSDLGWQQMRNSVADYSAWDVIISSPLIRCLEFATELSLKLQLPLLVEDNLKEVGFGSWEGRTQTEIQKTNPEEYANFYRDPVTYRPQGAEELSEFYSRVITTYNKILKNYQGQRILFVTHAGVIRAIMTHTLTAELQCMYRIKVQNAGFTRIIDDGVNPVLERHGFDLNSD